MAKPKKSAGLLLGDIMAFPDNQIAPKLTLEFQNLKNTNPPYSDINLTTIASKLSASSDSLRYDR